MLVDRRYCSDKFMAVKSLKRVSVGYTSNENRTAFLAGLSLCVVRNPKTRTAGVVKRKLGARRAAATIK